MVNMSEG